MQTKLHEVFREDQGAKRVADLIKQCVHCGFCNATCPTYQVLGDELDGPRGRIYLIKQMLEGGSAGRITQRHLDRCLTCLNCETTCPSGVKYGQIVDIGRQLVEARASRPPLERAARASLRSGLTSPLFATAVALGRVFRGLLPRTLRDKIPARSTPPAPQFGSHARKILLLRGCVQPALLPSIDAATIRVLDAAGIETRIAAATGCCGALRTHLADHEGGLDDMRRNIDAWDEELKGQEVSAIVSSATACALSLKSYGEALAHDAIYAARAARVSALARDLSELLPQISLAIKGRVRSGRERGVYHPPCTLQHGQKLRGGVEAGLRNLGFEVALPRDSHLCCGSAGTYSLLEPKVAGELRDWKLDNLLRSAPDVIVSGNVGCIQHLRSGASIPVKHWIEWLDEALT
ncbi:MAG TPA: glycolate oxidase subunit GlcF [Steroidobacteraceae bacterium]|jgi:glycolate oxidase iron-sulfur subunit